jgi:autotransporter-associated beta strand protein
MEENMPGCTSYCRYYFWGKRGNFLSFLFLGWVMSTSLLSAQIMVTNTDASGTGSLSAAITAADASPGSTIQFANNLGTLTLTAALPQITASVTINGGTGNTISGNNTFQVFFIPSGTVAINNLTIIDGKGQGGAGGTGYNGGGGGLGAGGAIFVGSAATVTLNTINLQSNNASGGAGGGFNTGDTGGGGGGLDGGSGGSTSSENGGGGGGSITGNGGSTSGFSGAGAGGPNGGGAGGNFSGGSGTSGGFGGGGGGGGAGNPGGAGGNGGFGGGGGGAGSGGSSSGGPPGTGGFGAGNGGNNYPLSASGSGGSGLGGAVFVENGGSLTVSGGATLSGNTSSTSGQDLYLMSATTTTMTPGTSNTQTYNGTISDTGSTGAAIVIGSVGTPNGTVIFNNTNTYTGGTTVGNGATLQLGSGGGTIATFGSGAVTDNSAVVFDEGTDTTVSNTISGTGSLTQEGTGTLIISGANSYSGDTTISTGTLEAENNTALGSSTVTVDSGASLQVSGASVLANNITISGTGAGGAGAIFANDGLQNEVNGNVTLAGNATVNSSLNGLFLNGTIGLGTYNLTLGGGANGEVEILGHVTGSTGGITVAANSTALITSSASDTYTGLTTVSTGAVLRLGDFSGAIAVPGDLNVSGAVVNLASGQFGTTSVVTLSGSGQFNFEGSNISETIAGLNGSSGTLFTPIANSGGDTLTMDGSGAYSYAGQINDRASGPAGSRTIALVMNGTGSQTLSGANNYSGGTTQSNGTLIAANAAAFGTGEVSQSGGTLETDNVNHTITMADGFDQTGGTLVLNLNGTPGAASNDQVHVTGSAVLGGNLIVNYTAGSLAPFQTQTYTAITTTTGITSINTAGYEPPALQAGALRILASGQIIGNNYDVSLTGQQTSFTGLPGLNLTANQISVASYLDRFDATIASGPFLPLLQALDGISVNPAALGGAFDQLTTLNFARFTSSTAFNNASFSTQQFDSYLAGRRGTDGAFVTGKSAIDCSGLVVNDPSVDSGLQMVHSRLVAWNPPSASDKISDVAGPVYGGTDQKEFTTMSQAPPSAHPWNVFVSGNVVLAQSYSDPSAGLSHTDATTSGVQLGADYRIGSNFIVGGMLGYGHTDATLDSLGSSASVDTYSPAIYAAYSNGGWYANALASYGFANYDQSRKVAIGAFNGTAQSSPDGDQIVGNLDGGYDFHRGAWTFGPTGGVQYVHLDVNSFTESGLPGADLAVDQNQADSLRSRLGGEVSYAFQDGGLIFTPHFNASWQHEFLDQGRGITSQFDGVGAGSFVVRTANPSRDSALMDLGLDAQIDETWTVFADYLVQAGQANYFGQSLQAGVKIGF